MTDTDTVNGWTDHGISEGGQSMGDGQVSDDIERRYTKPHPAVPSELLLVVTETYAVVHTCTVFHGADHDTLCDRCAKWYSDNDETPKPYAWDGRDEFRIEDTDGNEVETVEISYSSGSFTVFATVEEAFEDAMKNAQDHREFIEWDGE